MKEAINQSLNHYKSKKDSSFILELETFFLGTDFQQLFIEEVLLQLKIENLDGKPLVDILKIAKNEKKSSKSTVKVEIRKKKKKRNMPASETRNKRAKASKEGYSDSDFPSSSDAMTSWRLLPGSYGSGKR